VVDCPIFLFASNIFLKPLGKSFFTLFNKGIEGEDMEVQMLGVNKIDIEVRV